MENRSTSEPLSPTFEEFATFIQEWARIPTRLKIDPETLFEEHLGITGDDGCELLEATERHFRVTLSSPEDGYRRTFDLAPHEFLFHGEGFGWGWSDIITIFRSDDVPASVKEFRVGELFEAVKKAAANPQRRGSTSEQDA